MNIWEEYTSLMHIVLTTNQKEECFYVHMQITPTHKLYIYVASSTNISDFNRLYCLRHLCCWPVQMQKILCEIQIPHA